MDGTSSTSSSNAGVSLDARVQAAALAADLRKHTQGEVLFDAASRGRYATDASIYQIEPVGVFVPKSEDDVATALQIAATHKVPVLPRGGGTSQCGQTVGAALVIDNTKNLREVTALDLERNEVEVQPGIVLDALNAHLKKHRVWHPVDVSTSAQATLGGMAGNNSCGSRSIAYGNMVHNVAGIDAWLADGTQASFGLFDEATGRARQLGEAVRALARAASRRDRRGLAEGDAPRRRLQPRRVPSAVGAAVHRGRQCQPRPAAGRLGRHARLLPPLAAEARTVARAPRARAWSTSRPSTRRWTRRSTSSGWVRPRSNWSTAR